MAVLAPISGMPQFRNGKLVADAVAYFYDAGTTTDRTVYEAASGSEHTQPVEVTGAGNFPAIYIQGSSAYKIRIEDGDGVLIIEYDDLQGEVSTVDAGGGGGTTLPTGSEMLMYGTGAITGWARENGRTIGSASSGATERANADTEALFLHLWGADANLAVSGGRGASAAADWAANKTIALPDARGRILVGLDDMGSTDINRLDGGTFLFGDGTTLGSYGGYPTHALVTGELSAHTHTASTTVTINNSTVTGTSVSRAESYSGAAGGASELWRLVGAAAITTDAHTHSNTASTTVNSAGSGTAHNNMPPFSLRTVYIKL